MRARLLIFAAAVAVAAILVVRAGDEDGYRFDAVFDTGRGMVPGQLVKIAGAKVGEVERVALTADHKARMEFRIDAKFGPLHDDASCRILPEGFISENYVDCDPGTPSRPDLPQPAGADAPTVPVSRTQVALQLQQVIDTFSLPTDQRIRLILTELGIATAGRGTDINALLRRANPALAQARRALSVVNGQRHAIRAAAGDTAGVLRELSTRDRQIRDFVGEAAVVAQATAAHRSSLERSIRTLPPLLTEVRGSLGSLQRAAAELTPTARNLRAAAPELRTLTEHLPSFALPARRAVRALGSAADAGRRAIVPAQPVVAGLQRFAERSAKPVALARELVASMLATGGFENLQKALYGLTHLSTAFDGVSHVLSVSAKISAKCLVAPDASCYQQFDRPGKGRVVLNDPATVRPDALQDGQARPRRHNAAAAPSPRTPDGRLRLPDRTRADLRALLDRMLK
ncbi:MlaD family protein [Patulibacter medicamentivorans]|uniref:MlaD family protein n=1 Tax=Patulibacter medicamentivorans TaxID=1097667 RepID=UPI0002EAAE14|nr:MlaD family protein [Patulibacter medicamentivorans]